MPLFPLDLVPESELTTRLTALRRLMAERSVDGLLLTHRPDLFYFTGTGQDGWAYVSQDKDPLVFIKRYLPRAAAETPLTVVPVESVTRIPDEIVRAHGRLPKTMGLAFDLVPVRDYHFFDALFKGTLLCDGSKIILGCRSLKSAWEIQAMEAAAKVSAGVFEFMAAHLEPGLSETQFAGMIEAHARTLGHSGRIQMRHYRSEGFSFHIMSGRAGGMAGALDSPVSGTGTCTAYPFGAGPKIIEADEPVLVDFSCMVQGYHMDESRMLCAGTMPGDALDAGRAAMDLLFALKEAMVPGKAICDLFDLSVAEAKKYGLSKQYLGMPGHKARFVGHGIGLELVEPPILAPGRIRELAPGMTFAVEPKFVFENRFAAGIESVIRVTDNGAKFISVTPHKIFQI